MMPLAVRFRISFACVLTCFVLLGGCASTGNPRDPLEPVNRGIYTFNEAVDTTLLKPAAELYRGLVPRLVHFEPQTELLYICAARAKALRPTSAAE